MVTWVLQPFKIVSQMTIFGISFNPIFNNETEIDMVTASIIEDLDQFFETKPESGPPATDKVAELVNRVVHGMTQENKIQKLREKYR